MYQIREVFMCSTYFVLSSTVPGVTGKLLVCSSPLRRGRGPSNPNILFVLLSVRRDC